LNNKLDIRDLELNALLEITQAINNNLSEADLYRIYKFTLLGDLKLKKLAMFVLNESWESKVDFGVSDVNWKDVTLPEKYKLIEEAEPIVDNFPFSEFDLVFPVRHKNRLLAVVFLGGKEEEVFVETTFLRALTNILIVAIENKKLARRQLQQEVYKKELEIAKKVQNFLFPKSLPKEEKLKVEAVYLPHFDVGGDYYDYIKISDNKFLICIADVSGKGVPAALLMSNFQASLRALVRKTDNLDEIVKELNHATFLSSNGENFITVFIGTYCFDTKEFSYVNCGHNPTYIMQQNRTILELNDGTTILGMFEPLPFLETQRIKDLSSFLLFAFTDGLTETFNESGDQFGLERLTYLLDSFKGDTITDLHQLIFKSLDDFREDVEYQDDITMISCQVSSE
jgi:sigma-B regulation protein RsbU (phosphoserine phosphatase)